MDSILITDTNILIDMYYGNLLDLVKQLPYEFWISDFAMLDEFITPSWEEIEQLGIKPVGLTPGQVQEVYNLHTSKRQLSVVDISAYLIAKEMNLPLLTGDKHLRNFAIQQGVEVHGLLWLIDEAILCSCLELHEAASILQHLLDIGSRLPKKACAQRIMKWRSEIS